MKYEATILNINRITKNLKLIKYETTRLTLTEL